MAGHPGNHGSINTVLQAVGLTQSPIRFMYTEGAVIVGLTHVYFPFMALALIASLDNIDPNIMRAARSLGAGPLRRFATVLFPMSLPGVLSGSVVVFSLSAGAFITPSILGGGRVRVVAYMAYEQTMVTFNWPRAAAIGFLLLFVFLCILLPYNWLLERGRFRGAFESR
jgi:putative spermidine/putrescine transport system permease protein